MYVVGKKMYILIMIVINLTYNNIYQDAMHLVSVLPVWVKDFMLIQHLLYIIDLTTGDIKYNILQCSSEHINYLPLHGMCNILKWWSSRSTLRFCCQCRIQYIWDGWTLLLYISGFKVITCKMSNVTFYAYSTRC